MNVREYPNLQTVYDFHFGFARFDILIEDNRTRIGLINEKEEVVFAPEYIFVRRMDEHGRYQVMRPGEKMKEIIIS